MRKQNPIKKILNTTQPEEVNIVYQRMNIFLKLISKNEVIYQKVMYTRNPKLWKGSKKPRRILQKIKYEKHSK
jgi:hypothetical protein